MYKGGKSIAEQIRLMIGLLRPVNKPGDMILDGIEYDRMCKTYDFESSTRLPGSGNILPKAPVMKRHASALQATVDWYRTMGVIEVSDEVAAGLGLD